MGRPKMITQLFEKHYIDHTTGEILSEERVESYRVSTETFGMHRTTEGLEWIFDFTGNEFQMLIILLEMEDRETGIVSLSPLKRKQLAVIFDKSERYVRSIMSSLLDKNGLVKLTSQDYILNPRHFYKGGTKLINAKIKFYEENKPKLEPNEEF